MPPMHRGTPPPPPPKRGFSRSSSDGSTERPISLGQRIAQNIDMAKKGYEQLVHAIIRPPRANYKLEMLGPPEFTFCGQRFHREDVELLSSNVSRNVQGEGDGNLEGGGTPTCSFLKLQASIWTRVNNNSGDGTDSGDKATSLNPCSPTRQAALRRGPPSEDSVEDRPELNRDEPGLHGKTTSAKNTMVVYLHGNASARVEVVQNLSFLLAQVGVFGVVGLDFTGSGKSDGDYVSLGYYERVDLECMIQYLKRVYGGPDGTNLEIILWGRSMGASTALMHAGKKSFTAKNTRNSRNNRTSTLGSDEEVVYNVDAADSTTVLSNGNGSSGSIPDIESESITTNDSNNTTTSILKGLVCDSPFASLTLLCEELVERARDQGVVVPGVVVSVAIAMIARSVRKLANFNIREITPIDDVRNIDVPALFVVGADDDFITPHHSERLVEAYKRGVTTNLFMVPGGHNDARPKIVFEGIEEFIKQRLSLTEESSLKIPPSILPSIHENPPWAYHRTVHFQAHNNNHNHSRQTSSSTVSGRTAAQTAAEDLGMTKDRQDDIQNKIGLMMGGQGKGMYYSSEEEDM